MENILLSLVFRLKNMGGGDGRENGKRVKRALKAATVMRLSVEDIPFLILLSTVPKMKQSAVTHHILLKLMQHLYSGQ